MRRRPATTVVHRSLIAVATLLWAASGAAVTARADDFALSPRQAEAFATICARCHARPGIGVPVVGDEDAWAPLRAKGADVLLAHTIAGYGDMPPLGTCGYCSEDDLRRLVAFMAGLNLATEEERSSEEAPPADTEPSADKEPSADTEPSADKEPSAGREPSADKEPSADEEPMRP